MTDLSPTARRVLEQGRGAGEPDEASLARGRATLLRRAGMATAFVTGATTASAAAKAATVSLSVAPGAAAVPIAATASAVTAPLAVKVLACVAIVGLGASGAFYGARAASRPTPSAPMHVEPPVAAVSATKPAVPAPRPPEPTSSEATERDDLDTSPSPGTSTRGSPGTSAAASKPTEGNASSLPSAKVAPTSLAEDVAHLRRAQAALVAGRPRDAIEAAERVAADSPLADEREGIRILAGCALGTRGARQRAAAFVATRLQTPLAIRVRTACRGED